MEAKMPTSVSPMAASLHLHSWERGLEVSVWSTALPPPPHGVPGLWSVHSVAALLGRSPGAGAVGGYGLEIQLSPWVSGPDQVPTRKWTWASW